MLDRHGELVDYDAMMLAWDKYSKNPVILYNHSKTYGVIGKMTNVSMDEWDDYGMVPVGTAMIDEGESDITRKINKGMLKAFSIGFIAKAAVKICEGEDEECYIRFTEIDWVETSVVDVPASPGALFSVEKKFTWNNAKTLAEKSAGCGCGCKGTSIETNSCTTETTEEKLEVDGQGQKEMVGVDVYTTEEEASARAIELGCSGFHTLEDVDGNTLFMPCNTHEDYESLTEDSEEVELSANDLVKNPDSHRLRITELEDMSLTEEKSTDDIVETLAEEPVIEEAAIEEVVELTVEETVVETKEAVSEEAVVEEEVTEEVITEDAEADVEDSSPASGVEVLMEVVGVLKSITERMDSLESKVDATETYSAEIAELKSIVEARDATIVELTEAKTVAETEAAIELEVSKRVAKTLTEVGVEMEAPIASRKSAIVDDASTILKSHRFDPQPTVSPGMNGLAKWLEANIAGKGQ
jgi:HK97 family phage prohead protease